ncbi:hypothetical protein ACEPAG_4186 [Sanghuangporus baumii]
MPSFGVSSPFLPPDGDVVLRSADGHEFYVAKNILTIASPFFRSMFSLPQPEDPGDIPTISVSEDGKTFDILLRFCYPVKNPVVEDLSLADTVLAAALKYEMEIAVQSICRVLVSEKALGTQGLRVYAIACQHELIEDVYIEEFETMPTIRYFNLLKFHRRVKGKICSVRWSAIGDVVRSPDFNRENTTKEVESIICRYTSRGPGYREPSCNGVAS